MATKTEKTYRKLNAEYRTKFDAAFQAKFGLAVTTSYNIIALALITERDDGKKMNKTQMEWAKAFSDGYTAAMDVVG